MQYIYIYREREREREKSVQDTRVAKPPLSTTGVVQPCTLISGLRISFENKCYGFCLCRIQKVNFHILFLFVKFSLYFSLKIIFFLFNYSLLLF
jgi:hypothetical protein